MWTHVHNFSWHFTKCPTSICTLAGSASLCNSFCVKQTTFDHNQQLPEQFGCSSASAEELPQKMYLLEESSELSEHQICKLTITDKSIDSNLQKFLQQFLLVHWTTAMLLQSKLCSVNYQQVHGNTLIRSSSGIH